VTESAARRMPSPGDLLNGLFPVSPAGAFRGRSALIAAAAVLIGTFAQVIRLPGNTAYSTIWAEDASIFLNQAVNKGILRSFTIAYAGYLHTVPRVIAAVAAVLPLQWAAAIFGIGSALVVSLLGVFLYRATEGLIHSVPMRLALSAMFVAIPVVGFETEANAANLHFYFDFVAIWALLWRPQSRIGTAASAAVCFLAAASDAITLFLLGMERILHVGIFDPAVGGDPLLFQHLFWFYSHPAVYIMILPGMGVISELITAFSRKKIFGYAFVAFSSLSIAVISFIVWGHHMFVTGQSVYAGLVFSVLSFLVAIPSAVKVFNWTATLYKGSISYEAPMLYALGFIGLFTIGGLTGLFLAALATDVHLNGTYFIVAHFHYVMVGGAVMAYMGGLHFWWPKITGRLYPDLWARIAAAIIFIGFNLTFFPQFMLGYMGMPRRYAIYPAEFQVLNVMSSAGASILGVGYIIPLIYFMWSMRYGPPAGPNPWGAKGLEWTTQSPPLTENFETIPIVTEDAYNYASEAAHG